MIELLTERAAYLLFILPVVSGVYFMIAQGNPLMSVVGLYLVQSGVIFFYILLSVRDGATVPVLAATPGGPPVANPLPHALMLTAIVVGVALLGLAMTMLRRIQIEEGALREAPPGEAPSGAGDAA